MELYRHFDSSDRLLYVGISVSSLVRLVSHKASPWFGEIRKVTIEKFPTKRKAMAAERAAVTNENPVYNKALRPIHRAQRRRMHTPKALRDIGFPSTLTFDDEIWPMLDALRADGFNIGAVLYKAVSEWFVKNGYARTKTLNERDERRSR